MIPYELLHLFETVLLTIIVVLGGIYAIRTLKLLYGNPEMLKTQREIWLPILIGGCLLSISGAFHLGEHFIVIPEINLVSELVLLAGLSLLVLSIFRYWSLQRKYDETKHEALRNVKSN